ncbi:hypothetical protein AURDEDRAFT_168586 [Auricularia subglabra TFB-10046 SS5]|nr:hypothetical protein AURDEDRAFT_168586 [Auricularia subglabra TFB-10046 SS5]
MPRNGVTVGCTTCNKSCTANCLSKGHMVVCNKHTPVVYYPPQDGCGTCQYAAQMQQQRDKKPKAGRKK